MAQKSIGYTYFSPKGANYATNAKLYNLKLISVRESKHPKNFKIHYNVLYISPSLELSQVGSIITCDI
jgi:hypothetical protein